VSVATRALTDLVHKEKNVLNNLVARLRDLLPERHGLFGRDGAGDSRAAEKNGALATEPARGIAFLPSVRARAACPPQMPGYGTGREFFYAPVLRLRLCCARSVSLSL
jgi:hypothetical protein